MYVLLLNTTWAQRLVVRNIWVALSQVIATASRDCGQIDENKLLQPSPLFGGDHTRCYLYYRTQRRARLAVHNLSTNRAIYCQPTAKPRHIVKRWRFQLIGMIRVVIKARFLSLVRSLQKGYGPKSAVDIDMFAGENQSVAYLSDVDMERIGINCGDYLFVRCVVEEEDDPFFSMRKKLLLSIKIKRQSTL